MFQLTGPLVLWAFVYYHAITVGKRVTDGSFSVAEKE